MSNGLARKPRPIRIWRLALLVLAATTGLAVYLEPLPVQAVTAAELPPGAPPIFEVILVDGASMDPAEIQEIAAPMAMVFGARMRSLPAHSRIVVYGAGVPTFIGPAAGVAGFLPHYDAFFIDMQQVFKDRVPNVPRQNWWAFVMAHEAMHLVQQYRGEVFIRRGPEDYKSDPLEREAFREGLSVANSYGGYKLSWEFEGAAPLEPLVPDLYAATNRKPEPQLVSVRVSKANTVRGTLVRLKNLVSGQR